VPVSSPSLKVVIVLGEGPLFLWGFFFLKRSIVPFDHKAKHFFSLYVDPSSVEIEHSLFSRMVKPIVFPPLADRDPRKIREG